LRRVWLARLTALRLACSTRSRHCCRENDSHGDHNGHGRCFNPLPATPPGKWSKLIVTNYAKWFQPAPGIAARRISPSNVNAVNPLPACRENQGARSLRNATGNFNPLPDIDSERIEVTGTTRDSGRAVSIRSRATLPGEICGLVFDGDA
jgi:hypothetical protein